MSSTFAPSSSAADRSPGQDRRPRVTVDDYVAFRRDGFLVVRGLLGPSEVAELRQHTEELMHGRLPEQEQEMSARDLTGDSGTTTQRLEAPPAHLSPTDKAQYFLRIHMLHRRLELHERYLLHPGVLDVMEALIGPDVLALQTMLFLKPPGKPGQGWHQDSYYIPTHPDTLAAAWIAIDDADELNGAMWFAPGSHVEPVYPPPADAERGYGDTRLAGIARVSGVSDPDDERNQLTPVAARYPHVLVAAKAGDVVFFRSPILHRSKANFTSDRFRRAFVSHYCNARSFTQWGADADAPAERTVDRATGMTNGSHILARGDTHLPFARPRFGTPCAALLPADQRRRGGGHAAAMMADADSGEMGVAPADPEVEHGHA